MRSNPFSLLLLAITIPLYAADKNPNATFAADGPLLAQKLYVATGQDSRLPEIGLSSFTISVDCESKANAEEAIRKAETAIQTLVEGAITELKLGPKSELLDYKFEKVVSLDQDPVSQVFNPERKVNVWKNRCKPKEESDTFIRAEKVNYSSEAFSVWFPNSTDTSLNRLTTLVGEIEGLSDGFVKVVCNSKSGKNYDLSLTKSNLADARAKAKAAAFRMADKKRKADFEQQQYGDSFAGRVTYADGIHDNLPQPSFYEKDGKTWAKVKADRTYVVYYEQRSDKKSPANNEITNQQEYTVKGVEAETDEGISGTLVVTVKQKCIATEGKNPADQAAKVIAPKGEEIQSELEALSKEATPNDQLDIQPAFGSQEDLLVPYTQYVDGRQVEYYYDPCSLKNYEEPTRPDIKSWVGTQVLSITSDRLKVLQKRLAELQDKYRTTIDDPAKLTVTAELKIFVEREAWESLDSKLALNSAKKLESDSDYTLDCSRFSFACESQNASTNYLLEGRAFAASAPQGDYSNLKSVIKASERGRVTTSITCSMPYKVQNILKKKAD